MSEQREFMKLAISEARKCQQEPGRKEIAPMVGAVVVRDGKILKAAHRGELGAGEHAEYTVLEKKLKDVCVAGATVYCTLEPCSDRNPPKRECAKWLIERKVTCVVFAMLDPNPNIQGNGERLLRDAGIDVQRFEKDLADEVEDLNREFIRQQNAKGEELRPGGRGIRGRRFLATPLVKWNSWCNRVSAAIATVAATVVGFFFLIQPFRDSPEPKDLATNALPLGNQGSRKKLPEEKAIMFRVTAPEEVIQGEVSTFRVTAMNPFNNIADKYTGTVKVSCSDGAALLPENDVVITNGIGTFAATFTTRGLHTITAVDSALPRVAGTSSPFQVTRW